MSDPFVRDRLPPPDGQPVFLLLDYPERLNAAVELLKGGRPDALAVVNAHGRWSYAELDDFSGRIARLLFASSLLGTCLLYTSPSPRD